MPATHFMLHTFSQKLQLLTSPLTWAGSGRWVSPLENLLHLSEHGWTLTKGSMANLLFTPSHVLPGPTSETL